jgi:hypothetical protein
MNTSEFITLTELGKIYGVSSHVVGKWLKDLSLRTDDGRPSREAIKDGFVRECPLEFGGYFWVWHREKTCEILDGMCYPRGPAPFAEQFDGWAILRWGER